MLAIGRPPSYRPTVIDRILTLPTPDYQVDDVLVVAEKEQLRALADATRENIVLLLRQRGYSTTELAAEIGLAKGTIAHHVKVLQAAGLIRVVRTRKVRALTESVYGRVARLYLLKGAEEAADVRVRLRAVDASKIRRRLERLRRDAQALDHPDGEPYELAANLYEGGPPV